MSKNKDTKTKTDADPAGTALDKLKTQHDAVHHGSHGSSGGGLSGRGKSLEDDWIRREEKAKAEKAKAQEEKAKGNDNAK